MWKLLFIISLLPLILACLLSQYAGLRVLAKRRTLKLDAANSYEKFSSLSDAVPKLTLVKSQLWFPSVGKEQIKLKVERAHSHEAADHAYLWHQLGLALLAKEHQGNIDWRNKMVKTGYLLPPFAMMIVGMGVLVARIPIFPGIVSLIACVSFCTVMLWLSLAIELEAAKRAIHLIEKQRIYKSLAEEEAVVAATRAWSYAHLIPGVLKGIIGWKL